MPKVKLLINANELASMLGVSPRTIWRMNSNGLIPRPLKLNRSVRWVLSDVADWIEQRCPTRSEFDSSKKAK